MRLAATLLRLLFVGALLTLCSSCANSPYGPAADYYEGGSIHYDSFPRTSYDWDSTIDVGRPSRYRY
jgi:hypothetical protein